MSLNLKMTMERSKRRSHFLSLVFITIQYFPGNLPFDIHVLGRQINPKNL